MGSGGKKNVGRPVEVEGGESTSIRLGTKERRIVAAASRHHLGGNNLANRSRIIRQMIRTSWDRDREDLKESWKKDLIIADLQAKLQVAEERLKRLEAEVARARRPKGKKSHTLELLLHRKRDIERLVETGSRSPIGHETIDQFWHNRGRNWLRLLRDIQRAEALGVWPLPAHEVTA